MDQRKLMDNANTITDMAKVSLFNYYFSKFSIFLKKNLILNPLSKYKWSPTINWMKTSIILVERNKNGLKFDYNAWLGDTNTHKRN